MLQTLLLQLKKFLLRCEANLLRWCRGCLLSGVAFLESELGLGLMAWRSENLIRFVLRGVVPHQTALNGWLRVPRLLFLLM